MPYPSIARIRKLARSLDYVVSIHAAEELEDDDLTILDLENLLLTGQIRARQRDPATGDRKCVVWGGVLDGGEAEAVVKIGPTRKLFIITVYRA